MYNALGYEMPYFAHLPIILGPDRSKLSKRHGDVSVLQYRDLGYLPEAMFNFLSLLGWSLDDHTEILSREDLIRHFSIDRIVKSGAIFNLEKLTWMNGMYIRNLSDKDLVSRILQVLDDSLTKEVPRPISEDYVSAITPLVQERLKTMSEVPQLMDFFFLEELEYPPEDLVQKGMDRESTTRALESTLQRVTGLDSVVYRVPGGRAEAPCGGAEHQDGPAFRSHTRGRDGAKGGPAAVRDYGCARQGQVSL